MKARSGIGSLVLAATLIAFLLLGCTTQAPPASSGTATADTKPSGSVKVGWSTLIGAIDPMIYNTQSGYSGLLVGVSESLTTIDNNGNIAPGLAERWEIADDGLTQTFYLRKGVKFHDGSALTAADVKFSMERMLGPGVTAQFGAVPAYRTMSPQIEAKDDYTVVVRFKTPQYELLKAIVDYTGALAVVPKKYVEEKGVDYFRKNPIGSGPWKVTNFVTGQRVDLEANESYWDTNRIPKFKYLTVVYVSEEATKVAMLKTGELDIADVSSESAAALKNAGVKVKAWDGGQNAIYAPLYDLKNPSQYAFSDLRVRKAMSLSINRQEMADKLFSGYAEPGILYRVQRTFDFFDAGQLKADPYDAEGAKKLLAEAGRPNGFDTKIWDVGGGGILSTVNQALSGYWRKVGINAALEPIQMIALAPMIMSYSDARIWNTVSTSGVGTSVGAGVVGFDIGPYASSRAGFYRNHTNTKLDDLIEQYAKTKDAAQRKQMAREASILTKNEYAAVSVVIVQNTYALSSKIGDLTPIQGWPFIGAAYITMTHGK